MDKGYNLYNLEALFKKYLLAGIDKNINEGLNTVKPQLKRITVKNYLSDLRHFLGWLIFKLKVKSEKLKIDENLLPAIENIDWQIIQDYKTYLLENKIPFKTINRRLSTLRKFFTFCIDQGWLKENPAKKVVNISPIGPIGPIGPIEPIKLLSLYQKENPNKKEIEIIKEFISFIS